MKKLLVLGALLSTLAFGETKGVENSCLISDVKTMATFEVYSTMAKNEKELTNMNILLALRTSHVLLEHEKELSPTEIQFMKSRLSESLKKLENTPFMSKPEK